MRMSPIRASLMFGILAALPTSDLTADVLVLKDGTIVEGDFAGLLSGEVESVPKKIGPDVTLADVRSTHVGSTESDIKSEGDQLSTYHSSGLKLELLSAVGYVSHEIRGPAPRLVVSIRVTNSDKRRFLELQTPKQTDRSHWTYRMWDDVENEVRVQSHLGIDGEQLTELGFRHLDRIKPEGNVTVQLAFEKPLPMTRYLVLELSESLFRHGRNASIHDPAALLIPLTSIDTPENQLSRSLDAYEGSHSKENRDHAQALLKQCYRGSWDLAEFSRLHRRFDALVTRPIDAFEAEGSFEKFQAAVLALHAIGITDFDESRHEEHAKRISSLSLKRADELNSANMMDQAVGFYLVAIGLPHDPNEATVTKGRLVLALQKRLRDYTSRRQYRESLDDCKLLSLIDPKVAQEFVVPLTMLPERVLKRLPDGKVIGLAPIKNSIGMALKIIPAGTFLMGSPESEDDREEQEIPHEVQISRPFLIGVYEVTQDEYQQVMQSNPSDSKGMDHPVENISWNDAVEFCRRLSESPAEVAAHRTYRLPSEAEWEYACRAGTATAFSFGDTASYSKAWIGMRLQPQPVGGMESNPWGLFDMHGNVSEWCQDWYGPYSKDAVTDPTGVTEAGAEIIRGRGKSRVRRGGVIWSPIEMCRSASRLALEPTIRNRSLGFRVVCSIRAPDANTKKSADRSPMPTVK